MFSFNAKPSMKNDLSRKIKLPNIAPHQETFLGICQISKKNIKISKMRVYGLPYSEIKTILFLVDKY